MWMCDDTDQTKACTNECMYRGVITETKQEVSSHRYTYTGSAQTRTKEEN